MNLDKATRRDHKRGRRTLFNPEDEQDSGKRKDYKKRGWKNARKIKEQLAELPIDNNQQ